MKSSKWKRLPALLALVISLSLFSGCGEESAVEEDSATSGLTSLSVEYSEEDLDATWDTSSAVMISLLGNTAEISGDGAIMEENKIRITEGGTYVLSGSLEDGQILIEADEEAKIKLVLNAVEIKSSDGPAIYSVENDKVIITIAKGTSNRVEDSATYTLAEGEEEPNAAIFSKSDLTINGSGTLVVNGNYNNGIVSKDDLVITGGNVTVLAVNDGIKGRDSIAIKDGNFTITAKDGDALQASNDEDAEKGWISIDGGNFVITATGDGLQAESLLQVTNGTLSIACGDDGLHADAALLVEEGTILISNCYEGLEASEITVNGGTIDLTSEDDGFNAAGGNDEYYIRITGGDITIDAKGDGIDSNGSLYFAGGTVKVNGPTNNGNGPMDYNGVCEVTGGTLTIAGSSGMAQAPSDSSTQCSVSVYYSAAQAAGTVASLVDANGTVILSFAPEKEYSSIVFSDPKLIQGESYTLLSGESTLTKVTLSEIITKISEDGSAVTGGMGGQSAPHPEGDGERPERPEGERPEGAGTPPDGNTAPPDSSTSATTTT